MNYRSIIVLVSLALLLVIGLAAREVSSWFTDRSKAAPTASVDQRPATRQQAERAAPALKTEWDTPVEEPAAKEAGSAKPGVAPLATRKTPTPQGSANVAPRDMTDEELAAKFDPRKMHESRRKRYSHRPGKPSASNPSDGNQ